jgi:four helix bundle protein
MANSILKEKSFAFALNCMKLCQYLTENKKEFIISNQLFRSGTSIGANVREAQNAESAMDFIHKLAIAQKECDETMYWLELLKEAQFMDEATLTALHKDASEILSIIKSSILTVKQKTKK